MPRSQSYFLYINPMLNLNVNVGGILIVWGEGRVDVRKCFGRHFDWIYYVYLCKNVRRRGSSPILSRFGFKKYSNSIPFRYMFQLRLNDCTLVSHLVNCDAIFGFWLANCFPPTISLYIKSITRFPLRIFLLLWNTVFYIVNQHNFDKA